MAFGVALILSGRAKWGLRIAKTSGPRSASQAVRRRG